MPRPKHLTLDPSVDLDGICASQSPTAAGGMSIDGALASGGAVDFTSPHLIEIVSAGDDSTAVFTVTGTDYRGEALSETIAGGNATTVTGGEYFDTVTSVSIDKASAAGVTVGVNGKAATPWFPINYRCRGDFSIGIAAVVTGTINYTAQHTFDDLTGDPNDFTAFNHATMAAKTANFDSNYTEPATAIRCISNSGSGSLVFHIVQAG